MKSRKKKITLSCAVDNYRSGWTIVEFLAHRFPYHTAEIWTERVVSGQVLLNGGTARPGGRVQKDDTIQYTIFHAEPEVDFRYDVVYEDNNLLAVSKSGNIPVHACGVYITHTLIAKLKERFGEDINLAHRLDRETSGLVLLSKNKESARVLGKMFQQGEVLKKYLVIVYGRVPEEAFEVNAPIGPVEYDRKKTIRPRQDGADREQGSDQPERDMAAHVSEQDMASFLPKRQVDFAGGKPAVTRFERVCYVDEYTVLRAFPTTGRTNQIRVHLAYLGFPVVGDKVYGLTGELKEECVQHGLTGRVRQALVMNRQALHCQELQFAHPSTGASIRLTAPVPEDMKWAVGEEV